MEAAKAASGKDAVDDDSLVIDDYAEAASQPPQQPGTLAARATGQRTHFCIACTTPIAVYGRLIKCQHVCCLACATEMVQCYMCAGRRRAALAVCGCLGGALRAAQWGSAETVHSAAQGGHVLPDKSV